VSHESTHFADECREFKNLLRYDDCGSHVPEVNTPSSTAMPDRRSAPRRIVVLNIVIPVLIVLFIFLWVWKIYTDGWGGGGEWVSG